MKYFLILLVLIGFVTSQAYASSLMANIDPYEKQFKPSFQFQKTILIFYDDDGKIRDEMIGKDIHVYFSENSSHPLVLKLMQKLNQNLEDLSSQARITELELTVKSKMQGQTLTGILEYDLILVPTITNFVVNQTNSYTLLDMNWRALFITDKLMITSQIGTIDINHPVSFIKEFNPEFYETIRETPIFPILEKPLIDSTGLNGTLRDWHYRFIPWTSQQSNIVPEEWNGWNVSVLQKGDFTMRDTSQVAITDIDVIADKKYPVRIIENFDRGFIKTKGFVSVDFVNGNEILTVFPNPPTSETMMDHDPTWILFLTIGVIVSLLVIASFYLSRVRK